MCGLPHSHSHETVQHTAEGGWEPSRPGTVMLDIGDGRGALIVGCPRDLLGTEIEAEALDSNDTHPPVHTAVRERYVPGAVLQAAVFAALCPGRYRLTSRDDGGTLVDCTLVTSGSVTEVMIELPSTSAGLTG
jgi:hypothetical protein